MTKSQTFALIAFSAVLALVGFQNCSKVGVQDTSSIANGKVAVDGGVVAEPSPSDVANPPADQPPAQIPPVVMEPPTQIPPTQMPPDMEPPQVEPPKHEPPQNDPPVVMEPPTPKPPVADSNEDEINEGDAAALCVNGDAKEDDLKALKKVAPLSGPEVTHQRGVTAIESDDLKLVEDIRGVALIRGKTAAASAKKIINTRGKMIICGMAVDELNDTRGVVVLVNSNVKSVDDHRGVIFMMNSKIEKSSNIRGVIKEIKK